MNPAFQHVRANGARSPGETPRSEEPEPEVDDRPRSSQEFLEDDVESDRLLGPIVGW